MALFERLDVKDPGRYLVTGGTSGIGRAVSGYLTGAGHWVWITGTSRSSLDPALAEGVAAGGSVCDVRDPQSVAQAFAQAQEAGGPLDAVFSNAGIDGQGVPAQDIDPAAFANVLAVNAIGTLVVAQAAFRSLKRPGRLVINASVNAVRNEVSFADYNASKAAALSLAETFAMEWASQGLTVTCVSPGYFPSAMTQPYLADPATREDLLRRTPIGRFGEGREMGRLIEFLLSRDSDYLNGANVTMDGGSHL